MFKSVVCEETKVNVLCQLISESPVATVVCDHELLQLVQILSPFVCMQQLQQENDKQHYLAHPCQRLPLV